MTNDSKYHAPQIRASRKTPEHALETLFNQHRDDIESWLADQWQLTTAPITSSVDIRNAGFKVAPIDTNIFPLVLIISIKISYR